MIDVLSLHISRKIIQPIKPTAETPDPHRSPMITRESHAKFDAPASCIATISSTVAAIKSTVPT